MAAFVGSEFLLLTSLVSIFYDLFFFFLASNGNTPFCTLSLQKKLSHIFFYELKMHFLYFIVQPSGCLFRRKCEVTLAAEWVTPHPRPTTRGEHVSEAGGWLGSSVQSPAGSASAPGVSCPRSGASPGPFFSWQWQKAEQREAWGSPNEVPGSELACCHSHHIRWQEQVTWPHWRPRCGKFKCGHHLHAPLSPSACGGLPSL